jgi:uncharacterized protein YfbU (UPF0304 family)
LLYINFEDISIYLLARTYLKILKELLVENAKPYKVFLNIANIFDRKYKLSLKELKKKHLNGFPFLIKLIMEESIDNLFKLVNIGNC